MDTRRFRWSAVLLVASLLLLTACSEAGRATSAESGRSEARGASSVEVAAKDLSFTPATITAQVGQPITIILKNQGALEHDWAVMDLEARDIETSTESGSDDHGSEAHDAGMPEVHVAAMPGQSDTLTFTPTRAGRYEFFCSVPGHKQGGMVGSLIVAE